MTKETRTLKIRTSLSLVWLLLGAARLIAVEAAPTARLIPPQGIAISAGDRKELEAGAQALAKEVEALREGLKPALLELLPDVEIFHKAVDWAARDGEFYRSNEVDVARGLLSQGMERAARLRAGDAPWAGATGLVVRGYVSRIDGSVQFRADAPVKPDQEIGEAEIASCNLVLWGDPKSNKLLAKIADKLPVAWDATKVRVAEKNFGSSDHVPVLIYPNPLNPSRYVVLNSGFTFAHPRFDQQRGPDAQAARLRCDRYRRAAVGWRCGRSG